MSAESSSGPRAATADLAEEATIVCPEKSLSVSGDSRWQQPDELSARLEETELARLRRLLLGKHYAQLQAMPEVLDRVHVLEAALEDPTRQTESVARVLSEAMLLREDRDQGVSNALRTSLPDAIKAAVRKNPRPVVEAVSPVIGPAIRRSVSDALASMLELLDKLLEHNLSWRALKWRFEAWRSGQRYSELVLLRTLVYRVEQVLLIHKETGLLLQHVDSPYARFQDPGLVGGMLKAINDFASDSFSVGDEPQLQIMQVGDFRVIVEQSNFAILAAIVRGHPPIDLARVIREALESIEILYSDELRCFDGDATLFSHARPLLEDCLRNQQKPMAKGKRRLTLTIIGAILFTALGYWGVGWYRAHLVWSAALNALRSEPGIVVTQAARDGAFHRVHGLRDPLAREPAAIIGPEASSSLRWDWDLRPFLSAERQFLLPRALQVLQPPPTVELSLDGSVLEVKGQAAARWVDSLGLAVQGIPGITGYRVDGLRVIDDMARHREKLARLERDIESTPLYFGVNAVSLAPEQLRRLDTLSSAMTELASVAGKVGLTPSYLVTGHADATGSRAQNRRLSFSRASYVIEELVARGGGENLFLLLNMGVGTIGGPAQRPEERARNRQVSIDVILLRDEGEAAAK